MNRLLLLLLMLAASQTNAQQQSNPLRDVIATTNDVLIKRADSRSIDQHNASKRLLGQKHSISKNNDDTVQDVIHIQENKSLEVCLDTSAIAGSFGSLVDISCSTLNFGAVIISDNCFTYTANSGIVLGRDTLCIDLCDLDNNCTSFIYPIEVRNALSVPFFEDFSESSVEPNENVWQNFDVFVNNTLAISPPSIGVATFDGIDKNGRPYGGAQGQSDQLTSRFINLNSLGDTSDVYLDFWLQPKGYGDRPESIDSLILEFKNENGTWTTIQNFEGIPVDTPSLKEFEFQRYSFTKLYFASIYRRYRFYQGS